MVQFLRRLKNVRAASLLFFLRRFHGALFGERRKTFDRDLDDALAFYRKNLCPRDPRFFDPFPEKKQNG